MFEILKYFDCEKEDLSEINNTLIPMTKDFKDFFAYYVNGNEIFIRLTARSNLKKAQSDYLDAVLV